MLEAGEAGVQAARIRDHEDASTGDRLGFCAGAAAPRQPKVHLIDAQADERDHARAEPGALPCQLASSSLDVPTRELGRRSRRPRTEIRERDAELGEPLILFVSEPPGNQSSFVEQSPERIAVAGKVV